jgi:hypothetical protein
MIDEKSQLLSEASSHHSSIIIHHYSANPLPRSTGRGRIRQPPIGWILPP